MEQHQAIKIDPSTFKFIASLDIFAASFIKDEGLFPLEADPSAREAMCDAFLIGTPYCSPYAISTGEMNPRRFEYKDRFIQFSPSPTGLPTIRDLDVLIYCITWIAVLACSVHQSTKISDEGIKFGCRTFSHIIEGKDSAN